ncbi:MAG: LPS export ABC transporter periplasmic protein LptC [Candidatus Rokubacteria bacterium]|nr:LPS export ABC transporter periplasmic protein LptC [Candidatus Rokubacteria bacterium]MBI3825834.1 LPS export ABC transporter periplasmic protein LptC [Candidatus Rokubacteria bacterium]
MQRLASRILAVVAVFVLLVTGVLIAKSRTARKESVGPAQSKADLSIKELQLEEESGGVRWRLKADSAQVFEDQKRTSLKKVQVHVEEKTRTWTVTGEEGDLFQERKDFEVRRNVVMTSDDGMVLETSVLRWKGDERRLWTDVPVKITRERAVILGTALDVRMNEEATNVAGRVRATFNRGAAK